MKEWKDCGYVKKSSSGKSVTGKFKNNPFRIKLKSWQEVLEGKKPYALIYEPVEIPEKCPNCGSKNITSCRGGTALTEDQRINWICTDCGHEW